MPFVLDGHKQDGLIQDGIAQDSLIQQPDFYPSDTTASANDTPFPATTSAPVVSSPNNTTSTLNIAATSPLSDPLISSVTLVSQLFTQSDFASFTPRPALTTHVLAAVLDRPHLYTFPTADPNVRPRLLQVFPRATGVIGLCSLPCLTNYPSSSALGENSDDDIRGERRTGEDKITGKYIKVEKNETVEKSEKTEEYAVVLYNCPEGREVNISIWHVSLTIDANGESRPRHSRLLADMDGAIAPTSIIAVSERVVLVADSGRACIWQVDTLTGHLDMIIQDWSTMGAAKGDKNRNGIDQIRLTDQHIWFTNSSRGILCRLPVQLRQGRLRTAGPVRVLSREIPRCSGLVVTPNGRNAYTTGSLDGLLWRIKINDECEGWRNDVEGVEGVNGPRNVSEVSVEMTGIISPRSLEMVLEKTEAGTEAARINILCGGRIDEDENAGARWHRTGWGGRSMVEPNEGVIVITTTEMIEYSLA